LPPQTGSLASRLGSILDSRNLAIVVVALTSGWILLTMPGAWLLIASLFLGAAFTLQFGFASRQTIVMLLAALVGLSTFDYLGWRLQMTNWEGWWLALPLFIAELFGAIHTLGLQYTIWPRTQPQLLKTEDPTLRPVFIMIPTVNEGDEVLELTLRGALAARVSYLQAFPHGAVTIVVCNDGRVAKFPNWRDTEKLAALMGVECITRTVGGGAKAGNIEAARQKVGATDNALLVIFDADQIAHPDFLIKTIPPFADPTIGWVQTGQYYSNLDNPVARWSDDQQALFYRVLCPGKATINASFICGTNVVLRAAALDEIGGLPQDSVTEDFAASIDLHPTWRSIFLTEVLATGLGPVDLKSYFKQQRRWATGTLSVLRSHWRAIFLPARKGQAGLRLGQRIQYALACTHYLCGLRDLIYVLAPLAFLLTGIPAVRSTDLNSFLWHFLPYFLVSQAAFWYTSWGKTGLRGIILGFGCFPVLLGSLLTAITGRRIGFAVTSKQRSTARSWNHLLVHLLAILGCLLGLVWAVVFRGAETSVFITILWVIYTSLMLGGVFWLGWADARVGQPARLARLRPGRFLRPVALAILAVFLGGMLLTSGGGVFAAPPVNFALSQEAGQAPHLGIYLPYNLLASRLPQLERQSNLSFGIVERNQGIGESFDWAWAEGLSARGSRLWLTLDFRQSQPASNQPLTLEQENAAILASLKASSLPAIINGLHDQELRRWAHSIRNYGQPIYLSLLSRVDDESSFLSVANRTDKASVVSAAWQHVRTIFKQEGACNVAWVWAPADPTRDEAYAPPSDQIDLVSVTMFNFSDAVSPVDSARLIAQVKERYPAMPLLLEVSDGRPADQKAAWLKELGSTIASNKSNIHALVYHEAALDPAGLAAWSIASDGQVLQALAEVIATAGLQTPFRSVTNYSSGQAGRSLAFTRKGGQ